MWSMSTASPTTLREPRGTCGEYRLVARIGAGGMANVDLAVACGADGQNQLVVLKRLFRTLAADGVMRAMFRDEARIAVRLRHPNIVQTYEIGRDGSDYFIAMEYLDGQSLANLLRHSLPQGLPVAAVLGIAADVCAGLHYAHCLLDDESSPLGIVHRDVSPQNIFITYTGQVKLVDFGIAKAATQTVETQLGTLKGKIAYMSPEHAQGHEVDSRADVFSLGVVLYEALTHERMWGNSAPDLCVLRKLLAGEVPASPRAIVADLPEEVDRICQRALAPSRNDRYACALDMKDDLEAAIVGLGENMTDSEVGEFVARLFTRERESFAALLEERLGTSYVLPNGPGPESTEWVGSAALADTTRKDNAFTCASPMYSATASEDLSRENTTDATSCPTLLSSGTVLVSPSRKLPRDECVLTTGRARRSSRTRREWVLAGAVLALLALLFRPVAKSERVAHASAPSDPPARNSVQITPVAPVETASSLLGTPGTPPEVVSQVLASPPADEPIRRTARPGRSSPNPSYNSACSASLPSRQRLLGCGALSERK
jgi:serine/threonine protein kinase